MVRSPIRYRRDRVLDIEGGVVTRAATTTEQANVSWKQHALFGRVLNAYLSAVIAPQCVCVCREVSIQTQRATPMTSVNSNITG
jgi:hypothetical protein